MPTSEHLKSWNLFVFNAILTYIRFHLAVYSVCRKTWSRELRLDTCPQFWSLYANHLVDKPCHPYPSPSLIFLTGKDFAIWENAAERDKLEFIEFAHTFFSEISNFVDQGDSVFRRRLTGMPYLAGRISERNDHCWVFSFAEESLLSGSFNLKSLRRP